MTADVVVANILAGPLRELALLSACCRLQAVCWGFPVSLPARAESVCEAYAELFELDPVVEKEEWCRITGYKSNLSLWPHRRPQLFAFSVHNLALNKNKMMR